MCRLAPPLHFSSEDTLLFHIFSFCSFRAEPKAPCTVTEPHLWPITLFLSGNGLIVHLAWFRLSFKLFSASKDLFLFWASLLMPALGRGSLGGKFLGSAGAALLFLHT